ncbi:TetR family transcriptional regulator C-terminal domain-containing protein [uncultured Litoreibacter sp.]|uniref:TetR family transcriptional regulator C-terminal domain-containing protein n=1 Tax=uncultured Litoreibacter sp. TaxID=1392394 RepID=UPI00262D2353|nr:TetR family transcriptional regulator C-terminal domain-containing protein [uncultured Litoreibacter sp.]
MPHDITPPRQETRIQARNRATIREAALQVFSKYGFRGSTLDQIAAEAGLSKPNLLYYFRSKDAIYAELLSSLLETWLDPLKEMRPDGDPVEEIMGYVRRKLRMSQEFPRESRLFANEILQGAPHIGAELSGNLKRLVDEKCTVIRGWARDGKIADIHPHHLIFSIWSLTQHYADFDVQVRAVLGEEDPFDGAEAYLTQVFHQTLKV